MKKCKERKRNSRFLAGLLSALMILSLIPVEQVHAVAGDSAWTGVADGEILVKDTITAITDGVTQHEVITNVPTGDQQHIDYIAEIKMGDTIKVAAGYGRNDASTWSLTPTTTQAKAYESAHPGETVVAAINADFFNMANGQPMGALVMEGHIYNQANGRNYFGITKDGKAVIRNTADLSDLQVAVGGDVVLVENGQVCPDSGDYGALKYSRTAVGIKADGTVITFVTYGLRAPISCGRTYTEIAQMMQAAGCVSALALDGGGSSTYCSRPEGTDKLVVSNSPADGAERAVSSSLLVVSTAEATGIFDHAVLTPNNELYTPGTTINFAANGVDTAGMPMDLPSGTTWALSAGSEGMGTIDASTGVLTAGETCGTVGVDLLLNGEVIGSTSVEIVVPDSIYFANEEISLGFEQLTDFGLVVRNKNRDIHIKSGDIVWNMTDERMGTFAGNTFTSSDGVTVNGNVTATSRWDDTVSGSIHVIVGMLPTIVWDFEDQVDEETGAVISAKDYYTGENGILTHSNYNRGGNESIDIVTIDDDEPVRFGKSALKLNYDFRNCGEVTEGACVGTSVGMTVPGVPTGIGVWVYAPEGVGITYEGDGTQAGFWLRGYVRDGNGSNQPYDFVMEPKACVDENGSWNGVQPGISWEGWKYLEADLTKLAAPYSIQPGMTFRLMYVAGTKMGTKTANSVYFDNLQFVYGANVDDIDAPVVDSITVNGKTLANGDVLTDDTLNVSAIFHDVQNKYTSGIDKNTVRMYVDDVNVLDNSHYQFALQPDGTMCYLYNLQLENGPHTITVSLRDEFGNDVSETRTFTVKKETSAATTVSVVPMEQTAVIGKTVSLEILASDDSVAKNTTVLRLGNLFPEYQVTFADAYEGSSSFSKSSGKLTVNATRKENAAADADGKHLIATVSVSIPATLNSSALFSYSVKGGSFETTSGFYASYFQPDATLPVSAEYTVSAPPIIVSESGTGTLTVSNSAGEPAAGVSVYLSENDELIGVTDENGQLTTDRFGKNAGKYLVYAKDDAGLLSFQYNVSAYDVAGQTQPYGVRFNSPMDEATQKDISWISNPTVQGQQSIRYAVAGTDDWTVAAANTTQFTFDQGGYIVANFNNVLLTGLEAGTTYKYQVGCGEAWTEEATFSTSDGESDHADFFVLGDIQADDLTNITNIRNILKDGDWNFGLQTGDAVDNPYSYTGWEEYTSLFNGETMGSTNMVQVLGNHELQGMALESKVMFGLDSSSAGSYYSRTFGNVYLAVINYTSNAVQLRAALDWLKKDAQASNADWKILSMHQPAYYTNETGGNAEIYALVPDAVEEAGIDVVFSGHDHSLARTNPLRDDQVDEDNGILYYICGSSGEKSYSITTTGRFDYDTIFALATLDFNAVYLTAHADRDTLTINAYDVNNGLMDTYTLKSVCMKNGHKPVFDAAEKKVTCSVCGREIENFTGDVKDAEGNSYYLLGGVMQTGWVTLGEDVRYYNPNTGIQEELTVYEHPSTCIIDGYIEYTSASGAFKHIDYTDAGGHEYEIQSDGSAVCSACGHVRVNMEDTVVTLSYTDCTYTGKARTPATTAVAPDGTVLTKQGDYRDYYSVYRNNVDVGTASVTLTARKYGYYVDINDWRGNCKGSVTVTYAIHPDLPTDVQAVMQDDQVTLSWTAALSAPEYVIYASSDGKNYEPVGTTTDTSFTVPLAGAAVRSLRIGTQKTASDGKLYRSLQQTDEIFISPVVSGSIREETGKPALKWSKVANADHYQVFRAKASGSFELYYQTPYLSYTNTAAEVGHTYSYKVRAVYKDGSMSVFSPVVKLTAKCGKVTVDISENANGKPVLSWNAAQGADIYQVYRSKGTDGTFSVVASTKSNTYTDTTVVEGQNYSYYIVAVSENGVKGVRSESVSFAAPILRPAIKTGNHVVSGKPTLKWNPVDGAVSYEVYRSNTKDGKYVKVFTTTGTTYTHISAVEGKTYYYKVAAVFSNGTTHYSKIVSAVCRAPSFAVTAYNKDTGKPALKWTAVDGAVSYQVYRSNTENGKYVRVFTTTGTTYTHISAKVDNSYYYKVKVVFDNGSDIFSQVLSGTCICGRPEIVVGNRVNDGLPTLKWDAVDGAAKYYVYRSTAEDSGYVRVFTTTGTTYTHISAQSDMVYYYQVVAVSSQGHKGVPSLVQHASVQVS